MHASQNDDAHHILVTTGDFAVFERLWGIPRRLIPAGWRVAAIKRAHGASFGRVPSTELHKVRFARPSQRRSANQPTLNIRSSIVGELSMGHVEASGYEAEALRAFAR